MSTDSNPLRAKGALAAVAMSAWLVACASAWDGSTLSGAAGRPDEAGIIAENVGRTSRLTPACVVLAKELAHASIKARITAYRPTSRVNRGKEARALEAWSAGRCPDRALAGIAWGVAKAARASEEARRLDAELRP